MKTVAVVLMLAGAAGFAAWVGYQRLEAPGGESERRAREQRPVPVETAVVERGPIERRREFTGTLTAQAEFVVAPKVSGRVEQVTVDLADTVRRGEIVAKLDDAEHVQAVAQARADAQVARANLAQAEAQLGIAERELKRVSSLHQRGVASASQLDAARAEQLARSANVDVTRAQLARAEAELEATRIRLGYTEVAAEWPGGSDRRVVAERYVDEGETVAANAPLLRIVELDPLTAVFTVTERDYGLLRTGQAIELETDAFPGERFRGEIVRIAPVFQESSRQARVEARVENESLRLKPGLFVRISAVLERVEEATVAPEQALVRRQSGAGVFVLDDDGSSVQWRLVEAGIRSGARIQLTGVEPGQRVVVLGQQLLEDGSAVTTGEATRSTTQ